MIVVCVFPIFQSQNILDLLVGDPTTPTNNADTLKPAPSGGGGDILDLLDLDLNAGSAGMAIIRAWNIPLYPLNISVCPDPTTDEDENLIKFEVFPCVNVLPIFFLMQLCMV